MTYRDYNDLVSKYREPNSKKFPFNYINLKSCLMASVINASSFKGVVYSDGYPIGTVKELEDFMEWFNENY